MLSKKNRLTRQTAAEFNLVMLVWLMSREDYILEGLGVEIKNIYRLRRLSIGNLCCAVGLVANLNTDNLNRIINNSEKNCLQQKLVDRAIRCGARYELLHYYSGISRSAFKDRLLQMGYSSKPSGRISYLTEKEEHSIFECWSEIRAAHKEPLAALCALSETLNITLDKVWVTLGPDQLSITMPIKS